MVFISDINLACECGEIMKARRKLCEVVNVGQGMCGMISPGFSPHAPRRFQGLISKPPRPIVLELTLNQRDQFLCGW